MIAIIIREVSGCRGLASARRARERPGERVSAFSMYSSCSLASMMAYFSVSSMDTLRTARALRRGEVLQGFQAAVRQTV